MVNVRALANRMTSRINPNLSIGWWEYAAISVNADGSQVPSYAPRQTILAQVQALGKKSIDHLASLNISNCEREVYANVHFQATDRKEQTGGDILYFENRYWLVEAVLEGWTTAGWSRVAVSRQMDSIDPFVPPPPEPEEP